MSAWFLDSELLTCFLSSSLFGFLWPHKWAVCLSFDVAQAFQHDM